LNKFLIKPTVCGAFCETCSIALNPAGFSKQKLLKIGYPPPKVVALRGFYGYATAIFLRKRLPGSTANYMTTAIGGGFRIQ
jgi:hypothetical protein